MDCGACFGHLTPRNVPESLNRRVGAGESYSVLGINKGHESRLSSVFTRPPINKLPSPPPGFFSTKRYGLRSTTSLPKHKSTMIAVNLFKVCPQYISHPQTPPTPPAWSSWYLSPPPCWPPPPLPPRAAGGVRPHSANASTPSKAPSTRTEGTLIPYAGAPAFATWPVMMPVGTRSRPPVLPGND